MRSLAIGLSLPPAVSSQGTHLPGSNQTRGWAGVPSTSAPAMHTPGCPAHSRALPSPSRLPCPQPCSALSLKCITDLSLPCLAQEALPATEPRAWRGCPAGWPPPGLAPFLSGAHSGRLGPPLPVGPPQGAGLSRPQSTSDSRTSVGVVFIPRGPGGRHGQGQQQVPRLSLGTKNDRSMASPVALMSGVPLLLPPSRCRMWFRCTMSRMASRCCSEKPFLRMSSTESG